MKPIKILFLAANPAGTSALRLDREIRTITEKLRASEYREQVQLLSAWATRPDDLLQCLNEHRPHIVHFSGHGTGSTGIVLESDTGEHTTVSSEALASLFRTLKDNIRVVLLNACYSHEQALALNNNIDCVIGMNTSIGDAAAITFAAAFYRAIGFARSVQEAFEQALTALMLEPISEESIPKLLVRPGIDAATLYPLPSSPAASADGLEVMSCRVSCGVVDLVVRNNAERSALIHKAEFTMLSSSVIPDPAHYSLLPTTHQYDVLISPWDQQFTVDML